MDELYKRYGQLQIQAEILNGQLQECKRAIAEGLQRQRSKPEEKSGEQKPEPVQ